MRSPASNAVDLANALVGRNYRRLGRGPEVFDCYGLVLFVCERMGWPVPPDPMIEPGTLAENVAGFAAHKGRWHPCDPMDGAVALVNGGSHCGIGIAGGVLDCSTGRGVQFHRRDRLVFARAEWLEWV